MGKEALRPGYVELRMIPPCPARRNKTKPRDCSRGQAEGGNQGHERKRRRIKPAMPTRPVPSKPSVPGSGTVGGGFTGVDDVEKQVAKPPVVGLVPQAGPTRWIPIPVISVVLPAPLRTILIELKVPFAPFPVTSKQRVCPAMPPQVPAAMLPL